MTLVFNNLKEVRSSKVLLAEFQEQVALLLSVHSSLASHTPGLRGVACETRSSCILRFFMRFKAGAYEPPKGQ